MVDLARSITKLCKKANFLTAVRLSFWSMVLSRASQNRPVKFLYFKLGESCLCLVLLRV